MLDGEALHTALLVEQRQGQGPRTKLGPLLAVNLARPLRLQNPCAPTLIVGAVLPHLRGSPDLFLMTHALRKGSL